MVDLRSEFSNIINEYGQPALLIRANQQQRCKCLTPLSLAPQDNCPICIGTGYINKVEKIKLRTRATSSSDTLPKNNRATSIGDLGISLRQFFLDHTIRPLTKDYIVICEWINDKPVFDEYTEIYELVNVEPLRGNEGRVEYFIAVAQSDPVNKDIKLYNITNNTNNVSYYITIR